MKPVPSAFPVAPAWAAAMDRFLAQVIRPILNDAAALTESEWTKITAKFEPYEAWLDSLTNELLRGKLDEELGLAKDARERSAPVDYAHYVAKQLAPACDVVLTLLGTSFDRIAGIQRTLF